MFGSVLRWSHKIILNDDWTGRKVLEIGCFNGFFLAELKKLGAKVYGYDINSSAVSVGKELFALDNLYSSFDLIESFGPYSDIVCVDIIEHLDEPNILISKLHSILAPEGRLFLAGPTIERKFHDKSDYPPHHKWWFSRVGLMKFLTNHGFIITTVLVERDALLMLRNFIGKIIHGYRMKEFNGVNVYSAPSFKGAFIRSLYKALTFSGNVLFAILRISYCSTVIVAIKK